MGYLAGRKRLIGAPRAVFPLPGRCGLQDPGEVSWCFEGRKVAGAGDDEQLGLGQVGQQVVAQDLFGFEAVVFAGDDEDGDLDRAGPAGDVLDDPVPCPPVAGLGDDVLARRPRQEATGVSGLAR
jgi:hypothetical protein